MHKLLESLLKKKEIEDTSRLSEEEKATFDRWEAILSEGEITVSKIAIFCKSQLNLLETQLKNLDNSGQKNERLILLLNVYTSLLKIIEGPQTERETLEKYLNQLLAK